jgi:hypothetical protein
VVYPWGSHPPSFQDRWGRVIGSLPSRPSTKNKARRLQPAAAQKPAGGASATTRQSPPSYRALPYLYPVDF